MSSQVKSSTSPSTTPTSSRKRLKTEGRGDRRKGARIAEALCPRWPCDRCVRGVDSLVAGKPALPLLHGARRLPLAHRSSGETPRRPQRKAPRPRASDRQLTTHATYKSPQTAIPDPVAPGKEKGREDGLNGGLLPPGRCGPISAGTTFRRPCAPAKCLCPPGLRNSRFEWFSDRDSRG